MTVTTFTVQDETELHVLAGQLARCTSPGTVIALNGNLGAGKTSFVRGFATALGVEQSTVNSPTYVILQHYPGRILLHHFDLYRIRDEDELEEIGTYDFFYADGVCLVEWASLFPDLLPEDHLEIQIEQETATERFLSIVPHGSNAKRLIQQFQKNRN